MPFTGATRRSHKAAKEGTDDRLQFDKEVHSLKLASLILNDKQAATGVKSGCGHDLPNRRIRDPYVRWCERRTSSLTSGEAVYSIVRRLFFFHSCELVAE